MKIRPIIEQLKKANRFIAAGQLCLALALAAVSGPAHAADLPTRMPPPVYTPPPPAPEFSWTGFYLGVNAGYGIDHFAFPYAVSTYFSHFEGRSGITERGALAGVQGGFNYQFPFKIFDFPLNIVVGAEIDNNWTGIRGENTVNVALPGGGFGLATTGTKILDFGTLRERIGIAFGRFLPYFTAGLTYATVNTYYHAGTSDPFFASGSSTATRFGLFPRLGVVGIGLEYAFTNNLTVKAEYLYDFINARYTMFPSGNASNVNFQTRTMYHVGRVGLNYKFDWFSPAPVMAKY